MSIFYYFVPGARPGWNTGKLASLGLGYALEDKHTARGCDNGPGGQHGIVVCHGANTDGKLGYFPERQSWRQIPDTYLWCGCSGDEKPTPDDLARMPFTLLLNPCPASYVEHVRAVTLCAVRSAEVLAEVYGDRLPVRMDLLVAGALLHDVGKLVEYEPRADGMTVTAYNGRLLRHPISGMELAARCGLPLEVLHIIAAHADEGDKVNRTTEATLVNHADFTSFHSFQRAQKAAGAPQQSRM